MSDKKGEYKARGSLERNRKRRVARHDKRVEKKRVKLRKRAAKRIPGDKVSLLGSKE